MLDPLADALRGALEDTKAHRGASAKRPVIHFAMQARCWGQACRPSGGSASLRRNNTKKSARKPAPPSVFSDSNPWTAARAPCRLFTPRSPPNKSKTPPQGEMSASVIRYPRDWAALTSALKSRIGPLADVRMGIGLNFNRLDDTSSTGQTYTSSRASWLLWLLGATDGLGGGGGAPAIDAEGVRSLLGAIDFLGVSAYAPFTGPGFRSSELENAAFMLGVGFRGGSG